MDVTLLPMVKEVRPLQPEKARGPIEVTLSVIIIFVIEVLSLNNEVTVSQSNVTSFTLLPAKTLCPIDVGLHKHITEVRPLQKEKAALPMEVTLMGMVREVRPLQYAKALSPIDVTLLGMVKIVRPLQ